METLLFTEDFTSHPQRGKIKSININFETCILPKSHSNAEPLKLHIIGRFPLTKSGYLNMLLDHTLYKVADHDDVLKNPSEN